MNGHLQIFLHIFFFRNHDIEQKFLLGFFKNKCTEIPLKNPPGICSEIYLETPSENAFRNLSTSFSENVPKITARIPPEILKAFHQMFPQQFLHDPTWVHLKFYFFVVTIENHHEFLRKFHKEILTKILH